MGAALTLHFCDEDFANGARKSFAPTRECLRLGCSDSAFRGAPMARKFQVTRIKFQEGSATEAPLFFLYLLLRTCYLPRLSAAFASAPPSPGANPIGLPARMGPRGWSFGLMRYRSATVAGFHGLPRCLGLSKERLTSVKSFRRDDSRSTPVLGRFLRSHPHRLRLRRTESPQVSPHASKTVERALAKHISLNPDMTIYRKTHG